jgi:DNA invertase Pin-like site-specific DNA recombinase
MKTGAIWARISTDQQTTLPDQVARAKEKLLEKGYAVPEDRILAVDWTSLDLFNCPQFQRLYGWVKRKEIQALGILDRDRLQCQPEERLTFLAECKQAGVEWVLCQGAPIIDDDTGTLLEHV